MSLSGFSRQERISTSDVMEDLSLASKVLWPILTMVSLEIFCSDSTKPQILANLDWISSHDSLCWEGLVRYKNAAARNFVTQSGFYLDNGLRNFEKENFDNIRVWFNNKGWAASVSYMNAVNNIVLRAGIAELRKTFI